MAKYQCDVCGYIYDEEKEEKKWDELPDDWKCPLCEVDKEQFSKLEE